MSDSDIPLPEGPPDARGGGGAVVVRPYEQRDRAAVRRICHATGYMGDPVDWLWRDAESFAEMFTAYYTDAEPQSALVAELDGEVRGYLLGCTDSRRAWNPAAVFARQVVRRGIALRPGTAGFVWRSFADIARDALHRRLPPSSVYDERWPAHLHIDLLPAIRGRGVGATLVRRWLEMLRAAGVPGCHLETLGQNHAAISFFESAGFRRMGTNAPAPGMRSASGGRLTIQLMVQPLSH
jgi:ribosomal protein S18 acetylase RimI-like enzyme